MVTLYRHGHAPVHARRQLVVCTRPGSRWKNEAGGRSNHLIRVVRASDFVACSCLVTEASKGGRVAGHAARCCERQAPRGVVYTVQDLCTQIRNPIGRPKWAFKDALGDSAENLQFCLV